MGKRVPSSRPRHTSPWPFEASPPSDEGWLPGDSPYMASPGCHGGLAKGLWMGVRAIRADTVQVAISGTRGHLWYEWPSLVRVPSPRRVSPPRPTGPRTVSPLVMGPREGYGGSPRTGDLECVIPSVRPLVSPSLHSPSVGGQARTSPAST